MAEPAKENNKEVRADPTFKIITTQAVQEVGIKVIPAEFPQALSADLALEIPDGIEEKLEASLFNFLKGYQYAIVEFKGQNDAFTLLKFLLNLARTALFCTQHPDVPVKKVLNLYVCSKFPEGLLELANTDEWITFVQDPDRPWLWRASFFFQEIIIVVCRDLPLDPVYYNWLIFAPASTQKWREFVKAATRDGKRDILDLVKKLRPKEFNLMQIDVEEILSQLDKEEREQLDADYANLLESEMDQLARKNPQRFEDMLESLLASLPPTSRAEMLNKLMSEQSQLSGKTMANKKGTMPKKPRSKPTKPGEGRNDS